jgi:O-antigen ligase
LITFCSYGLVGLALFYCTHFLPILLLLRRLPVRDWTRRGGAAAGAMVVGLCVFVCDCLFNAMINSIYIMALGGVTALAAGAPALRSSPQLRPVPQRRAHRRVAHCLS